MSLREELSNHFSSDFFPCTASDLCAYIMSPKVKSSKEVADLIMSLENDDSFKYNSIDDILPMPSLVEYPYYKMFSTEAFCVKVLNKNDIILVQNINGYCEICKRAGLISWCNDWNFCSKEQFEQKFNEVFSLIKSDI